MRRLVSTKLVIALALVAVLGGSLLGPSCAREPSAGPAKAAAEYKWALGHIWAAEHPAHKSLLLFAELVNARTGGRVEIEVQPAGALGGDTDLMSGVSKGDLMIAYAHTYGFDPKLAIYDMPYLARDWEDVDKLWHGEDAPVRKVVDMALREHNVMVVGVQGMDNDFRGFTNNKRPIRKPEDMAGLKVRMSPVDSYTIPFGQGLKVSPVWIAFPELYQALQLGTVDAQENGIVPVYANRFLEVQKYYTDLRHIYSAGYILANVPKWNALPEDIKQAVIKSAEDAALSERTASRMLRSEYLRLAKEQYGTEVTILTPEEWAAFRDIYTRYADPVVEKLAGKELFDSFMADAQRRLGRSVR